VEGEIDGSFAISQQLNFGAASAREQKMPNLLDTARTL
jgi:hypothetical protein